MVEIVDYLIYREDCGVIHLLRRGITTIDGTLSHQMSTHLNVL